jgi:hypothetical protein
MARGITFRVDRREFDKTLKVYREYSKRDVATICNTKAFYIARRATVETQKSTKSKIRQDLLQEGRLGAPIAALIVNARRGAIGAKGLFGKAMRAAVNELIKARKVASLASGWIPAIKAFEPLAEKRGAPRQAAQAKLTGDPSRKGYGKPAKEGWVSKAVLANLMTAKWDTRESAGFVATPALQRAFDAEEASMKAYIERKLNESAKKAGIKTS